ncbi:MAG: 3-phosphoshikimate 1-carboxyvinyltransferase [Flavobacterium sp.]|nr:MAG: 3-phosphoshikimate 1-carboxyvinyltransferase [Flavobacterium sp.]
MKAILLYKAINKTAEIIIPGSKSESNRLLILQALFPNLKIQNLSNSDDTVNLAKGLKTKNGLVDIHHAGTAMRFLTAYFASKNGSEIILTGSERMQERPIKILVDALKNLGAEITYIKKEGYPPIKIKGRLLTAATVNVMATISSQYISALMLVAPSFPNGICINLQGKITSAPYINMTLDLLKSLGVNGSFSNNTIKIASLKKCNNQTITIESDWSSASYFYSLVALSDNLKITLKNYRKNSLQGDSELVSIYTKLGVETVFNTLDNSIQIQKTNKTETSLNLDLINTPDIAQTIVVTCFGLGLACGLKGLKTLKIKETDRLNALKTELEKLGANIVITNDGLELFSSGKINKNIEIETYQDHRMAMAFAPLAMKTTLVILQPNVVTKSYATFWEDLKKVGISTQIK